MLVDMLQVIVDTLKDPSSMQLHSVQSRAYGVGDGRIATFNMTAPIVIDEIFALPTI